MKKRIYVMAVVTAVSMLFGSLTVSAKEKAKLDAVSKEKTLEITLVMPDSEKGTDAVAGTLDYDHTKLELEEVKTGDPRLQDPVFNSDNGKFTTLIKSESIRQSVYAVKFVFKMKSDVTGETTVRVSELAVADAEDVKQMYDNVSVKAVLGDKQKPSEDKDNSSTPDKGDSSTPDKGDSSTPDKGDSSTPDKGDSSTPDKGDSSTPDKGDSSTPDKGDSSTPGKDDSSTPDKGDSSTPDKGDSSTPGKDDSSIINKEESQDSLHSGTTDKGEKGKTDTEDRKTGARTGDEAAVAVWIAGMIVSIGVLAGLIIRKRKNRYNQK